MCLVACRSTSDVAMLASVNDTARAQVIERTAYHSDTVYLTKTKDRIVYINGDSIYIHDSIYIDRMHSNSIHDTLYLADTLQVIKTDTIFSQRTLAPTFNARAARNGAIGGMFFAILFIACIIYLFFKHRL